MSNKPSLAEEPNEIPIPPREAPLFPEPIEPQPNVDPEPEPNEQPEPEPVETPEPSGK